MRKLLLIILVSCLGLTRMEAYTILPLGNYNGSLTLDSIVPVRTVTTVSDGIVVDYTFKGIIVQDDELYSDRNIVRLPGFGLNDVATEPSFLFRQDDIELTGYSTGYSLSVIDSAYVDLDIKLAPARPALCDSSYTGYTLANVPPIASYTGFAPLYAIRNNHVQYYRGSPIASIGVTPVKYNEQTNKLRVFTKLTYKLSLLANGNQYMAPALNPITVAQNDHYLANTTINYTPRYVGELNDAEEDNRDYLIITVPEYLSVANEFAEWKKELGFRAKIKYSNQWTPQTIYSTVKNVYDSIDANLYYVLIIGGHNDVPGYQPKTNGHITDYYYSCLDGTSIGIDKTPDIRIGRLPARTFVDAQNMIEKIIFYEKTPVNDQHFYKHGLSCALFQDGQDAYDTYEDRRFVLTAEEIKNYLDSLGYDISRVYTKSAGSTPIYWNNGSYSFGEQLPEDLRAPLFAWNGNGNDIVNGINTGSFFVLHRDHGAVSYWDQPRFSDSHINQLNNLNKYPIIFSINCRTGSFNQNNCFCEMLLKKGCSGGVACFGATDVSYSGRNDALTEGLFDAIWPSPGIIPSIPYHSTSQVVLLNHPIYELGAVLQQGKKRLKEIYYDDIHTNEIFHLFGDPSMMIYTDQPTVFDNVSVNRGSNLIDVSLGSDTARIAFYNPTTNVVDAYWGNSVSYVCSVPDSVIVCVSAHNKIPYIHYDKLYIQNETISSDRYYNATSVEVGTNVTTSKPQGDVIFNSGNTAINAKSVRIKPNTTINKGSIFEIKTK